MFQLYFNGVASRKGASLTGFSQLAFDSIYSNKLEEESSMLK
jgi:hypothetical protein